MKTPVTRFKRKSDLRKSYILRLQLGFILSLSVMILLVKVNFDFQASDEFAYIATQEEVMIEDIIQTKQELKAPPPPRPPVPVEVPNDEVIEDEIIEINADLDFDMVLELTSIPPPPEEKEEVVEEEIFVIVEKMPELIGGMEALNKEIRYPEMAIKAGIEGRVVVQFVIDKQGSVQDPVIIRGVGGGCDEEAIRAIKKMKFKPGMQRGKPVPVRYSIPISFNLKSVNS